MRTTRTLKRTTVAMTMATTVAAFAVSPAVAGTNGPTDPWAISHLTSHADATPAQQYGPPDPWAVSYLTSRAAATGKQDGAPDPWAIRYLTSYTRRSTHTQPTGAVADGRSPDTLDAANQAHAATVTVVRSPRFAWAAFAVGVAAALVVMLLGTAITLIARQRRHGHRPVATT
jgi:hypothetical protein